MEMLGVVVLSGNLGGSLCLGYLWRLDFEVVGIVFVIEIFVYWTRESVGEQSCFFSFLLIQYVMVYNILYVAVGM